MASVENVGGVTVLDAVDKWEGVVAAAAVQMRERQVGGVYNGGAGPPPSYLRDTAGSRFALDLTLTANPTTLPA